MSPPHRGCRIWGGLCPKGAKSWPVCRSAAPDWAHPYTRASTTGIQCIGSSEHEAELGKEWIRSVLKRGTGFSESSGRSITFRESHLWQNESVWFHSRPEWSDIWNQWVSRICVPGWCLSREGHRRLWHWPRGWRWMFSGPLPLLAFLFPYSQSCTYLQNWYVSEMETKDTTLPEPWKPHVIGQLIKTKGNEFPSKSSPFAVKHLPSVAFYTPGLFLCSFFSPLVLNQHDQPSPQPGQQEQLTETRDGTEALCAPDGTLHSNCGLCTIGLPQPAQTFPVTLLLSSASWSHPFG